MTKKDTAQDVPEPQDDEIIETPETSESESPMEDELLRLTEALQRERADALNLRRRHEVDMTNVRTRVKSSIIHDLLPVIDNFERALKHVPAELTDNDYIKGVQGVVKQFETTLSGMGVERIETEGEVFDPNLHEAVSMDDGEGETEYVGEELQSGFKIGDDVIRHAMVRVVRK